MLAISTDEAQQITEGLKADKHLAEYYLLNFKEEEERYNREKTEYLTYKEDVDENVGGGRSGLGNPTEQQVFKSIEFDSKSQQLRWLKAVAICRAGLGERKNIFIACRIDAETKAFRNGDRGRKAWVVYTQQHYAQEIEKRFLTHEHVSEITCKRWWKDIIDTTVSIANKL